MDDNQATKHSYTSEFILRESLVFTGAATLIAICILIVAWKESTNSWNITSPLLTAGTVILALSITLAWITNHKCMSKSRYARRIDELSILLSKLLTVSNYTDAIFFDYFTTRARIKSNPATEKDAYHKAHYLIEKGLVKQYSGYLEEIVMIADQTKNLINIEGKGKADLETINAIAMKLKSYLDELENTNSDLKENVFTNIELSADRLKSVIAQAVKSSLDDLR